MKVTLTPEEVEGILYDRLCATFSIKKDTLKPVLRVDSYDELVFEGYEFEMEG